MTAFDDVVVKVNQWSYEEEQRKYDNNESPYDDSVKIERQNIGNITRENEELPF